jgi:dihydroneopterin aldolase
MKNIIELNGIQLYTNHGCLSEEGKIGGHYTVDVKITTDFSAAFESDELADTVDYVAVNNIVTEEMDVRSKLIEHVGHRIVKKLKKEIVNITQVQVKIIKHSPPIGGDVSNVAIIIEE